MANSIQNYSFPTNILSGIGARKELPKILSSLSISKPLIVTDNILSKLPVFLNFMNELKQWGINASEFCNLAGNPNKSQVIAGVSKFKESGADGIIAFGGGSAIDVAKCIGVGISHKEDLFDYEDIPGSKSINDSLLPSIVALPTTAGTGSEVGRSAVVSDDKTHRKVIIFSPGMLPKAVILDPELHIELPASITATTGMDALTHCIEAFLVDSEHPMCDGIALEGIYQISNSLKDAYEFAKSTGRGTIEDHLKARSNMMNAAMMGAVAFQKGLGVNHSCAHALSTVGNLHHGLANAIMLPHSLLFNLECAPEKFKRMAQATGCGSDGLSFIKWVKSLNADINIPANLNDSGVSLSDVPRLVEVALKDACHPFNVKPVVAEDFDMLFKSAF